MNLSPDWWKAISRESFQLGWKMTFEPANEIPTVAFESSDRVVRLRGAFQWCSPNEGTLLVVLDGHDPDEDSRTVRDIGTLFESVGLSSRRLVVRRPSELRTAKSRRIPAKEFVRLCRVLRDQSENGPFGSTRRFASATVEGLVWESDDDSLNLELPGIELHLVENPWARCRTKGSRQLTSLRNTFVDACIQVK
jgi:hypothetical protein